MSNSSKVKRKDIIKDVNDEEYEINIGKTVFVYPAGIGGVTNIYKANFNEDPKEVSQLFLRVDDLMNFPLEINNHPVELSTIINNEYQLIFEDEVSEEGFFNDLFYFIEEFHHIPKKSRTTSTNKIINLEEELISLQQEEE